MNTSYTLLIEWDGNQPPKTWYRRLASFRIKAGRQPAPQKTGNPLTHRNQEGGQDSAVMFQEGAIICSTESTARLLASFAVGYGAVNVSIIEGEIIHFEMTPKDAQTLNRVNSALGKRGRSKAEVWTVACKECMQVGLMEAPHAIYCPTCLGVEILARRGAPVIHSDPGGHIVDAWVRSRFANQPHWEPVQWSDNGTIPPAGNKQIAAADKQIISLIGKSTKFLEFLEQLNRETAVAWLDAVYLNRRYVPSDVRDEKRISVIAQYVRAYKDVSSLSFVEEPEIDLIDGWKLGIGAVVQEAHLMNM